MIYEGHFYQVTDEEIKPTGKIETYVSEDRDSAVFMALYTHRLHNGQAWATSHGVIHCPSCGQIAIVKKVDTMNAFRITYEDGTSYVTSMNGTLEEVKAYFNQFDGIVVTEDPATGKETRHTISNIEQVNHEK